MHLASRSVLHCRERGLPCPGRVWIWWKGLDCSEMWRWVVMLVNLFLKERKKRSCFKNSSLSVQNKSVLGQWKKKYWVCFALWILWTVWFRFDSTVLWLYELFGIDFWKSEFRSVGLQVNMPLKSDSAVFDPMFFFGLGLGALLALRVSSSFVCGFVTERWCGTCWQQVRDPLVQLVFSWKDVSRRVVAGSSLIPLKPKGSGIYIILLCSSKGL